jgi:hypothetical protein
MIYGRSPGILDDTFSILEKVDLNSPFLLFPLYLAVLPELVFLGSLCCLYGAI